MILFVGLLVIAFYAAQVYFSQSLNRLKYEADKTPFLIVILVKIMWRILTRSQGVIQRPEPDDFKNLCKNKDEKLESCDDVLYIHSEEEERVAISNYR